MSFRERILTPVGISHVHSPLFCCQPTTDGLTDDGTQGLFELLSVSQRKFPGICKSCRIVCDWDRLGWNDQELTPDHASLVRVTFKQVAGPLSSW